MKKIVFKTILLVSILAFPISTMANGKMEGRVIIPMPPVVVFAGAPHMVVIPQTYVYAMTDINADIFFFGGWWWRPWQGRWYRSHDYRSGWNYYRNTPSFYRNIPSGWRNDYRNHRWNGHQWEHNRIPLHTVKRDWNRWEKDRHWEKQNNWGVHDMRPATKPRQQYKQDQHQNVRERQQLQQQQQRGHVEKRGKREKRVFRH